MRLKGFHPWCSSSSDFNTAPLTGQKSSEYFLLHCRALREIWRTHPSDFLQISRSATWAKTTRKVTFGLIYKPVTSILNINITLTHGIMLIILTVNSMLHTSWSDGKMSRFLIIPESIHFYCFYSKYWNLVLFIMYQFYN